MNAEVQTKQAIDEMSARNCAMKPITKQPKDGADVLIQALKRSRCRSNIWLSWWCCLTDL